MTISRIFAVAAAAIMLAACTSTIKSDVARFHNMPAPSGQTFAIVPFDEANGGGLEFEQYAGLVRGKMIENGFRADSSGSPDLIVRLSYGISEGEERLRGYGGYPYGAYFGYRYGYFGHHTRFRGYYNPYYGPYGYGYGYGGTRSYTVYTRSLEIDITDSSGERLFEGRVISVGRDNRLPEVMPYLVQALFTDFPGQSGTTIRVAIDLPSGERY